jgi:hypothetical protein
MILSTIHLSNTCLCGVPGTYSLQAGVCLLTASKACSLRRHAVLRGTKHRLPMGKLWLTLLHWTAGRLCSNFCGYLAHQPHHLQSSDVCWQCHISNLTFTAFACQGRAAASPYTILSYTHKHIAVWSCYIPNQQHSKGDKPLVHSLDLPGCQFASQQYWG